MVAHRSDCCPSISLGLRQRVIILLMDVATIIRALEELYSLRPEDKYLAHSSKWHQVVVEARKKACIQTIDMTRPSRRDTINEWSTVEDTLDPIPYLNNDEILHQ